MGLQAERIPDVITYCLLRWWHGPQKLLAEMKDQGLACFLYSLTVPPAFFSKEGFPTALTTASMGKGTLITAQLVLSEVLEVSSGKSDSQ